jgi:hypothetical protein
LATPILAMDDVLTSPAELAEMVMESAQHSALASAIGTKEQGDRCQGNMSLLSNAFKPAYC